MTMNTRQSLKSRAPHFEQISQNMSSSFFHESCFQPPNIPAAFCIPGKIPRFLQQDNSPIKNGGIPHSRYASGVHSNAGFRPQSKERIAKLLLRHSVESLKS
jgi:hypothetical protein